MSEIDLSKMSYEEFVKFFFDRDVIYLGVWKEGDITCFAEESLKLIRHFTKLCKDFTNIVSKYSWSQINQAMWGILRNPAEVSALLMSDKIAQFFRAECIQSMYFVFSNVVQKISTDIPMEDCFFMWWHTIAGDFCKCQNHCTDEILYTRTAEFQETHDVIFEILLKILALKTLRCQLTAIHGLGHLHHPKGAAVVQRFIDRHKDVFSGGNLRWLEQCRDGTVS